MAELTAVDYFYNEVIKLNVSKEASNKAIIRALVKELFQDKYIINFEHKERKKNYNNETLAEITEIESILQLVREKLDFCKVLNIKTDINVLQKYALIYILKKRLNFKSSSISEVICDGDHTNVSYAVKKATNWIETKDEKFIDILFQIQNII
jgi:hypothetical protein